VKKVAILGAGFVTKPLVDYLIDRCNYNVIIATRTKEKADAIIAGRSLGRSMQWTADQQDVLDRLVQEVDLVISMIPPTMHIPVAQACLRHKKPLVTTSYISPEMQELDDEARERDVLLLNELGEDPGLDHMGAKQMIDDVDREGGSVTSLISYGAGLPSFEHNRNPFGYKFSWSPRGVMLAAQTAAGYLRDGEVIDVPAEDLFSHHWLVDIDDVGTFETYPNRDSVHYAPSFGLEEARSLYRGLLRFPGWCNTMKSLVALNMLDGTEIRDFSQKSYLQFTSQLAGRSNGTVEDVAAFLDQEANSDVMNRLRWLGLFEGTPVAVKRGANVDVLVDLMLKKKSYAPGEKDMILVHDEIITEFDNKKERRLSTLLVEGIPYGDSAMSRAVSLPAAISARRIMEGELKLTGVRMPTLPEIYRPILDELDSEFDFRFRHKTIQL